MELSRALHAAILAADDAEPDSGHLGLHEQPDLLVTTILRFVARR